MFRLFPERPNIPFSRLQPLATVLSLALFGLGIWSAYRIATGKARVGTDFAGGLALELNGPVLKSSQELRDILEGAGFARTDIQEIHGRSDAQWRVRVGLEGGETGSVSEKVLAALRAAHPGAEFGAPMVEEAGPAFSKKLQRDALRAVLYSFLGILLYIAVRFEFWYAVAAIVASFHDIFVTLGILSALGYEFNLLIVSALLILLGYSLNDTVVIFDRIRENVRANPAEPLSSLVHRSLNETLSRTIITGGVTLLTLAALYVVAGGVLEGFSIGLIIGITIGTYSSVFVAAPLVVWLRR